MAGEMMGNVGSRVEKLKEDASKYLHYNGSSMFPTFKTPEFIVYAPVKFTELRPGDIIAYTTEGSPHMIVHRIIKLTSEYAITRGDNNLFSDDPVRPEQISGKISQVLRNGFLIDVSNGFSGKITGMMLHFRSRISKNPIWQWVRRRQK